MPETDHARRREGARTWQPAPARGGAGHRRMGAAGGARTPLVGRAGPLPYRAAPVRRRRGPPARTALLRHLGLRLRHRPADQAGKGLWQGGQPAEGRGLAPASQDPAEVRSLLATACRAARNGDLATATLACLRIKFVGPAFATKLVMAMRPDIAAVLDSVINERLRGHADRELAAMHGPMASLNSAIARDHFVARYLKWCDWCMRQAQAANALQATWPDWDGSEHPWRAVDVERAFFAMGRAA
ncbi:hypothetical protein [Massilia sp. Dwa41.01b]|uniref:8-oxoguanine DNA glycosylase OGG fold protein n=1 Tax=Massilia sp. Dwa41.01b TaxID=2709302 RepID=UPI0035A729FD